MTNIHLYPNLYNKYFLQIKIFKDNRMNILCYFISNFYFGKRLDFKYFVQNKVKVNLI